MINAEKSPHKSIGIRRTPPAVKIFIMKRYYNLCDFFSIGDSVKFSIEQYSKPVLLKIIRKFFTIAEKPELRGSFYEKNEIFIGRSCNDVFVRRMRSVFGKHNERNERQHNERKCNEHDAGKLQRLQRKWKFEVVIANGMDWQH